MLSQLKPWCLEGKYRDVIKVNPVLTKWKFDVENHANNIKKLFSLNPDLYNEELYKKLRRYEVKANKIVKDFTKGKLVTMPYEKQEEFLLEKLDLLLKYKYKEIPVFMDWSLPGYTLKVEKEFIAYNWHYCNFYRDERGDGIIAPLF